MSFVFCLLPAVSWAAPIPTIITADQLEYFSDGDKYIATGNVRIEKDKAVLRADRVILFNGTADAEATGHVIYEDPKTFINAEQVEMNLETNTGNFHNALILLKEEKGMKNKNERVGYWIRGIDLQRIKEDHYYAKTALFTTCTPATAAIADTAGLSPGIIPAGESPDWCFKGSDVDLRVGDRVKARDTTFRVKGWPAMYSPYIWTPVLNERQTGFLMPLIGLSNTKGFQFGAAFFWAIDENKDATFNVDYYSKRGVGKGVEYRYLDFDDKGKWYMYNINDTELKKKYYEFKGDHEQKWGDIKGFVDINYVNQGDFFQEFAYKRDDRLQRYLQSSGEVSAPLGNARMYLLGQYWVDLQDKNAHVPQRLPEAGYVMNTTGVGPLLFSLDSSASNFARTDEVNGQRLYINPTISHSFGDWVQMLQSVSLRETAYQLKDSTDFRPSLHRETFGYTANALSRFIKYYDSSTHIMEPSLTYSFVPETHPTPIFDSIDDSSKISAAQLAFSNTVIFRNLTLSAQLAQPYDFNAVAPAPSLKPTSINAGISNGPLTFSTSLAHDFIKGKLLSTTTTLSTTLIPKTTLTFGDYVADNTLQFNAGVTTALTRKWAAEGLVYYDAKGQGVRDLSLIGHYKQQCWGMDLVFIRRPGSTLGTTIRPDEYSFMILFELKGVGGFKPYEFSSQSQQKPS